MKKILTLLFLFSSTSILLAQSPLDLWKKTFGGSQNDRGISLVGTADGGCVFVASAYSSDGDVIGQHNPYSNSEDFWVVKLDAAGTIQWQKCLGGWYDETPYQLIQVADGGYVIVGASDSNDGDVGFHYGSSTSFSDLWITKLDSTGNLIWQKNYGGYSTEYGTSVSEATDGGLFVAAVLNADYNGTVPVTYSNSMDYWIIKLNSVGEMQWNDNYGGENGDRVYSIKSTPDGGCIAVGQSGSHYGDVTNSLGPLNTDFSDYWVLKLNATGGIQWQKSYGGSGIDWATSLSLTNDGGYIIAGNIQSNNTGFVTNFHGASDGWVIKLDSTGGLVWQKTLGGSSDEALYSIIQTADGGYLTCGNTLSTDGDLAGVMAGNKAWIVKLDSNGAVSWQRHYLESFDNVFNSIIQNTDGTTIAIGCHQKFNPANSGYYFDAFIVKLDVNSLATSETNQFDVVLYPNAVNDVLNIQSNGEVFKEINVYDILGKKVDSFTAENNSINLSSLQKGIYFVEIKNEQNQSLRKKIVKN